MSTSTPVKAFAFILLAEAFAVHAGGVKTPPIPLPSTTQTSPVKIDTLVWRSDLKIRSQAAPYIEIEIPKVYNNYALRQRLDLVKGRLSALHGFEQSKITDQLGTTMGASVQRTNAGVQAPALPAPGVVTKNSNAVAAGSSTNNSGTEVTQTDTTTQIGTTNQLQTKNTGSTQTTAPTSPSSSSETTTTTLAFTPTLPALPSTSSFSTPSQVSQGPQRALTEQLQLEMELVTLQTLLEAPLNSEYSPNGDGRTQLTFGIPITIPATANYSTRGAAAEILVAVCPGLAEVPDRNFTDDEAQILRPLLVNIIPKEKTYNTAAITNKSLGIGLGSIFGVFSVAGNFSWTRDTYYIVQAQDTVALTGNSLSDEDGYCDGRVKPLRFGWTFKPVLGQTSVQAGLREALVQLSVPRQTDRSRMRMSIETRWREFDKKTRNVGEVINDSPRRAEFLVPTSFDTLKVTNIAYRDARQNNSSVSIAGHFLPGTKVRLGATEVSTLENTGSSLEFIASNSALAAANILIVSPDGQKKIWMSPCEVPWKQRGLATPERTVCWATGQNLEFRCAVQRPTIHALKTASYTLTLRWKILSTQNSHLEPRNAASQQTISNSLTGA